MMPQWPLLSFPKVSNSSYYFQFSLLFRGFHSVCFISNLFICLQSDVEGDADFMNSFSIAMDGSVLSGMIIVPTTSITNCLCIYFLNASWLHASPVLQFCGHICMMTCQSMLKKSWK
jgi:hypothetical protein